jgi:hypothetical protein
MAVGVDSGRTFTDVCLLDEATGDVLIQPRARLVVRP